MRLANSWRLHDLAQPDGFAVYVGHLHADGGFSGHALDENAFGFQREAEIVLHAGDARILDASFRLEFEGRNHGAGIDLGDRAVDLELGEFFDQNLCGVLQFLFVEFVALVGAMEQRAGGQFPAAEGFRHCGARLGVFVCAGGDLDVLGFLVVDGLWRGANVGGGAGIGSSSSAMRSMPDFGSTTGTLPRIAGTSWAVTTGFCVRRFSNSFCALAFARAARQSSKRSQAANANANRVWNQRRRAANENAVER